MRKRVILSITNNAAINRETRANAIDNTTRTGNESFDIDVCLSVDYKKFDFDLFITDVDAVVKSFIIKTIIINADTVVEGFIIKIMSFEMLIIRCSLSVSLIANINT